MLNSFFCKMYLFFNPPSSFFSKSRSINALSRFSFRSSNRAFTFLSSSASISVSFKSPNTVLYQLTDSAIFGTSNDLCAGDTTADNKRVCFLLRAFLESLSNIGRMKCFTICAANSGVTLSIVKLFDGMEDCIFSLFRIFPFKLIEFVTLYVSNTFNLTPFFAIAL